MEGTVERKGDIAMDSSACDYPEDIIFKSYTTEHVPDKTYPGHYVIFNLAFEHGVSWSSLKYSSNRKRFCQALEDKDKKNNSTWKIHPYLTGDGERNFSPEAIFTEASSRSLFGSTQLKDVSLGRMVENRLNPRVGGDNCFSETLMFTLESSLISNYSQNPEPLNIKRVNPNSGKITYEDSLSVLWVDLWFMPDGTGMLSFKVVLDESKEVGITRCTRLVRTLRDFKDEDLMLHEKSFWADIVFGQWLGFKNAKHSDILMTRMLPDQSGRALSYVDHYSRYCKTLIAVQTPDIRSSEAVEWGRPLADPPVGRKLKLSDNVCNELKATRYQNAVIAGYATVKDMIPFELATMSDEGHSVGWIKDGEGWQYSLEYIRKMIEENFIEVWEYWAGLALRDSCVFVSYNKKVPIMYQAEARYYPLYVHTYHLRHRLDILSDKIVDYGMSDAFRGRRIQDQFQRFRNHFWFQESTKDFVGVEVFNQMKKGMNLPELYESVSSEVTEVAQHLQQKWERSIRMWLLFLGVFTWPIKTVWDTWLFPKVLEYGTAHIEGLQQYWLKVLIATLILITVLSLIHYLFGRFRHYINPVISKVWTELKHYFLSE